MNESVEYGKDGMLIHQHDPALPEVLDALIVGGGPAGTAAAFRAKELGLSALVIDYDDIMKRIRDYAKDKLILPDFGGGDKMRFPKGGDLVARLEFPPLDKDEMCALWKSFYVECGIPAQVGIELLGAQSDSGGLWEVRCYNHNLKADITYKTRHLLIGIGRGVPRRFDIPGNTEGIAYRLNDAKAYVGKPACIIGGGTSAAEAVIEISKAKIEAGDKSAVFWSYRGDKLPKVSKALAEVFFDAYLGNGNIRYHPNSEPIAVMAGDDRCDYLAIRTERKSIVDRPNETTLLEFEKECCVACIGEDIPETLLNGMGIYMMTGGPSNKKRMVVNRYLETQQPNIFLIGDLLSQAYFETDDFGADPSTFQEIKHRGNIKAALVDAVYVIEVIRQRLDGLQNIHVEVAFADEAEPETKLNKTIVPKMVTELPTAELPAQSIPKSRATTEDTAFLVRVLPGDVEEDEIPLKLNGMTTIGRKDCDISIPDDSLLSDLHASILHTKEGFFLQDDGSENGVFYKVPEGKSVPVPSGTLVRLGKQFLVIEQSGVAASFIHYDQQGTEIQRRNIDDKTIVLGRDAPDVTLAADDMILSRRHIALSLKNGTVVLKDLKSLNGTFLKVLIRRQLEHDDRFRIGRQTFRINLAKEIRSDQRQSGMFPAFPEVRKSEPPKQDTFIADAGGAVAPSANGLVMSFTREGITVGFDKGQSICDVAEKSGVKIVAECHAGICGSDPIRICKGMQNLNPPGDAENETLADICELEPGEYRLACMAKPTGPVDVETIAT
ncbi:MAG: FHA domain-containing protein [Bacteroidota bacterium]|jgi:thioredoxin reductase/pSer/pThr/pTyr-binding forkhead associated (FHA) protein/ferredoxin